MPSDSSVLRTDCTALASEIGVGETDSTHCQHHRTGGLTAMFATQSRHQLIVKDFIVNNFYVANAESLADDTSLVDQGIIDSTGILEVAAFLESEFGIKVADSELLPENLETIGNIAAFVARKQAA